MEYRWAKEEEYMQVIELANHAFDEKHHTGDFSADTGLASFFPACLPKLYQNPETAGMHYLAVKDGTFAGNVALFDLPTTVAGNLLHVGGIGTVCTRPGHRREGLMKKLMADVIETAEKRGLDYLVLGGQRQRYEHWGFECAGLDTAFMFWPGNFDRLFSEEASFGYTFRKIREEDEEIILHERLLRMSDGIVQIRKEELEWKALFSMFHQPYVILKDGRFMGTFLLSKEEGEIASVADLRLVNEGAAVQILNDLLKALPEKKALQISKIAPERKNLFAVLYRAADAFHLTWSEMIKILNYERTIKAYLEYKASYTELFDGEITLGFANGEMVRVSVKNGKVNVYPAMFTEPDAVLSELDAVNLLFGPGNYVTDYDISLPKEVRQWFPLPFFMAMSDEV